MHADACRHRRTHTDEHRRMQNIFQLHSMSKLLYVLSLSLSPHQSLFHVDSFSRFRNRVGTRSIVSETPPTNSTATDGHRVEDLHYVHQCTGSNNCRCYIQWPASMPQFAGCSRQWTKPDGLSLAADHQVGLGSPPPGPCNI